MILKLEIQVDAILGNVQAPILGIVSFCAIHLVLA